MNLIKWKRWFKITFTNWGAQAAIYGIGSNRTNNHIQYFAIGSGSGTALVTNVTLAAESGVRVAITGSPDFTTVRKVTFTGDYNSTQLSGLNLTEFGLFASGAQLIGSTYLREAFTAVTFDGTNELNLNATIEAIPG